MGYHAADYKWHIKNNTVGSNICFQFSPTRISKHLNSNTKWSISCLFSKYLLLLWKLLSLSEAPSQDGHCLVQILITFKKCRSKCIWRKLFSFQEDLLNSIPFPQLLVFRVHDVSLQLSVPDSIRLSPRSCSLGLCHTGQLRKVETEAGRTLYSVLWICLAKADKYIPCCSEMWILWSPLPFLKTVLL